MNSIECIQPVLTTYKCKHFNTCLTMLNDKQSTHPNLTKMWIEYLSNKCQCNNGLTNKDMSDCMNALELMNTITDITDLQVQTLIAFFS